MTARRDLEVQIEFLPTEHGGRTNAARSGYRPQLYYDGHDWDAVHEYPDVESVLPGEHARAYLCCLSPEFHVGRLIPGKAVLFREGQRVVAFGTVVRVLDISWSAYAARVSEALTYYQLALFEAAERLLNADDRSRCKEAHESVFSIRRSMREQQAAPDLRSFAASQMSLVASLSTHDGALSDAADAVNAAVGDGPPQLGAG
jgi:hypothetical protein